MSKDNVSKLAKNKSFDVREDDVEKFIKEQIGLPNYIDINSLGPIMQSQYTLALNCYNKAKENTYTEEQVREAIEMARCRAEHIFWYNDEEIIESLKQPK